MDFQKKAEEVLSKLFPLVSWTDEVKPIAAALKQAYQEGAEEKQQNILRTESSEWIHTNKTGEVACRHSRMVKGVLCRWWGMEEPPGVNVINEAARLLSKSEEVK